MNFADPKNFMVIWLGLGLASMAIWYAATPDWRQKWRPYAVVGFALVFLLFVFAQGGRKDLTFAALPVALIVFLNLKTVKVCPNCGETSRPMGLFFSAARYCAHCGSSLDDHGSGQ